MIEHDYFDGYRYSEPHPMMTSTGSNGFCDICGRGKTRDHDRPWTRVAPRFIEVPDPPPPLEPYTGSYGVLLEV